MARMDMNIHEIGIGTLLTIVTALVTIIWKTGKWFQKVDDSIAKLTESVDRLVGHIAKHEEDDTERFDEISKEIAQLKAVKSVNRC